MLQCHFLWRAHLLGDVGAWLFVAGRTFGDVGVSLFVELVIFADVDVIGNATFRGRRNLAMSELHFSCLW